MLPEDTRKALIEKLESRKLTERERELFRPDHATGPEIRFFLTAGATRGGEMEKGKSLHGRDSVIIAVSLQEARSLVFDAH